jgi:hypothetical protein
MIWRFWPKNGDNETLLKQSLQFITLLALKPMDHCSYLFKISGSMRMNVRNSWVVPFYYDLCGARRATDFAAVSWSTAEKCGEDRKDSINELFQ